MPGDDRGASRAAIDGPARHVTVAAGDAAEAGDPAYAQPAPRVLYVHDDLSDEARRRLGPAAPGLALVEALLDRLRAEGDRVVVLTLEQQLAQVIAQEAPGPFDLALGIGRAGERVAAQLHARTGWFPRIRRLGLTRVEDGRGGYRLASTEDRPLAGQLAGLEHCSSLAVVDDTVFSGLTMRAVLEALPPAVLPRTRAFCLRAVADSLGPVAALCPVTAGIAAAGRILHDVSFINASGLVLRVAIRRPGRPPLAFFDRPEWLLAWFPRAHAEVLALCRQLNALLEPPGSQPPAAAGTPGARGRPGPRG